MMNSLDKIAVCVKQASSVAIICHTNPDPDTVCSALALYNALLYFNKEAHIYCENTPGGKVAKIKGVELINSKYWPSYHVCICVDCADIYRLGVDVDVFRSSKTTINIDHHKTNTRFADLNYVNEYASSTCEMLYRLILRLDPNCLNNTVAKLLYTGMVADSGAFTFPSTSTDTMCIAGELMRFDFNASQVCYDMIKKVPKSVFNLKIRALKSLVTYDKNSIGVIKFTQNDFKLTRTQMDDTSGIINEVLNIAPVRIAIAITEADSDTYKVSIRSKGMVDISNVAESFGGGGHLNAAGCELFGEYDEILLRIIRECRKALCKA